MEAKFTPGPWETSNGARVYAPGETGLLLATCAYLPYAKAGQDVANARLMAAAPELLDELRVARSALSDFAGLTAPHAHALARRFAAAIAKATGERA